MFFRLIQMRVVPTSVTNTFLLEGAHLQIRRSNANKQGCIRIFPLRAKLLMPLVTTPPSSDADATSQYLRDTYKSIYASPVFKCTACLYSAAPSAGWFHKVQIEA